MKKVTAALAVLLALTLTGCASGSENAADERTAPSASESAAPLVAEEPAEKDVSEAEVAFLEAFRDLQGTYASIIPNATDEQLLAAGYEACERLAAGEASTDITLIEGEERNPQSEMYLDSVSIVSTASPRLCP